MARFKPKEWSTPKTRGWRRLVTLIAAAEILKDLWPLDKERPAWAKLALSRHWMTPDQYYAVPLSEPGKGFVELLYKERPFFKMLRKDGF